MRLIRDWAFLLPSLTIAHCSIALYVYVAWFPMCLCEISCAVCTWTGMFCLYFFLWNLIAHKHSTRIQVSVCVCVCMVYVCISCLYFHENEIRNDKFKWQWFGIQNSRSNGTPRLISIPYQTSCHKEFFSSNWKSKL